MGDLSDRIQEFFCLQKGNSGAGNEHLIQFRHTNRHKRDWANLESYI